MKNITFFASFIIISNILFAQAPDTVWTKTLGGGNIDEGRSIQQTADGGYIITGETYSFGSGSADVWLIKTNADGDTLWTKTIGADGGEIGQSVQQTEDGGYVITGSTSSFGAAAEDILLIRTNGSGDTLWTKTFGGSSYDGGYSVQPAGNGGYIVTGRVWSADNSRYDIWLARTDSLGHILSSNTYGGLNDDIGNAIQPLDAGGFITTGVINIPGKGNDVWLARIADNGDTLWTKNIGGNNGDGGNSVQPTKDGGYIITGYTHPPDNSSNDVWLIKTDTNGDTLWTKTFGGSSNDNGFCVRQTSDSGYIISGVTSSFGAGGSDIWLIRTDSGGNMKWTKTIGGGSGDYGYSVVQSSDGGFVLTGVISSDLVIIKVAGDITDIGKTPNLVINNYSLQQNYPNPFNPSTSIRYTINRRQKVSLKIFDLSGKEITTLVDEEKAAGIYAVKFDGGNLASGVYFYQLQTADFTETRKMILIR